MPTDRRFSDKIQQWMDESIEKRFLPNSKFGNLAQNANPKNNVCNIAEEKNFVNDDSIWLVNAVTVAWWQFKMT